MEGKFLQGIPYGLLALGKSTSKKIACAVSMSDGLSVLDDYEKELVRNNLKSFRLITCREQLACDGLAELTGDVPGLLCDPTFTYNPPVKYDGLLGEKADITNGKKNVLIMLETPDKDAIAAKIKSDLGEKYNLFSMFRYNKDFININVENPFEWAEIINEADFVITNLYHGTIFSILSNTPFISLCLGGKREKILSLSDGSREIEERFVSSDIEGTDFADLIEKLPCTDFSKYVRNKKKIFEEFTETLKSIY